MIIAIIIDPESFNKETFTTEVHTLHAEDIIESLKKNSLIIVDTDNKMMNRICDNLKNLPYAIEHILRYKGSNIIRCLNFNSNICLNFINLYTEIVNSTKNQYIDVIITNESGLNDLCKKGIKDEEKVVLLKKYRDSKIEKKRKEFLEGSESLDRLERWEVDELISRVLWYTRNLSFYDPIAGGQLKLNSASSELNDSESKAHLNKWVEGISYILTLWENNCYFKKENKKVKIYTEATWLPYHIFKDYNKRIEVRQKIRKFINENLINPLKERFPWCDITLHIKNRKKHNIFRSRYLQTDNVIVKFDKGFDLLKNDCFLCNDLSIALKKARDLKDIRKLDEIYLKKELINE